MLPIPKPQKRKKQNLWEKERRKLKEIYKEKEIIYCEIRLQGCFVRNFLGFAHKHKRKWYLGENSKYLGDFDHTVLACQSCHEKIENNKSLTKAIFETLR